MQATYLRSVPRQKNRGESGAMTRGPGTGSLEIEFNNLVLPPTIRSGDSLATQATFGNLLEHSEIPIRFINNTILPQTI